MDYFKIRLNRSHPIYMIKFILVPYILVLTSPRAINKSEKKIVVAEKSHAFEI